MLNSGLRRALGAFVLAATVFACGDRGLDGGEGRGPTPPPPPPPEDGWEHFREPSEGSSAKCTRVFEFTPAPGQWVGDYSAATPDEACEYASGRLAKGEYVSLGGWGGYIVVGFDHSIPDGEGADFAVGGNAQPNGSEPGIVWVSRDTNGNGVPDDEWFELSGSETSAKDYSITYHRGEPMQDIQWEDNRGGKGTIWRNAWHNQPSYYPAWVTAESYTLTGSLLPSNVERPGAPWKAYGWGYADNMGNDYKDGVALLDIANATRSDGTAAGLKFIDFVKIQTAINDTAGVLGELSTEVTGVRDL